MLQRFLYGKRTKKCTAIMEASSVLLSVAETRLAAGDGTFEDMVGITIFANNSKPFNGILKQRFSDFVVREVSLDGIKSVLKDTNGNELESVHFRTASSNSGNDIGDDTTRGEEPTTITRKFLDELKSLSSISLVAREIEELTMFLTQSQTKDESCSSHFIGLPNLDKEARTTVHQLVKKHLFEHVETVTEQANGKCLMKFLPKHLQKQSGNKRKRAEWPNGLGNFLKFTLLKENVDTMSAVNILNRGIRCSNNNGVAYSGTKDKRGVTAQKCTVYRRKPSDFSRINASNMLPRIYVGDFEYVKEPVQLGDLGGNFFEITLRSLSCEDKSDVLEACAAMQRSGFINYFGLQRFGKGGSKSHDFGRSLLKSDWQSCVQMLFTAREGDKESIVQAKEFFKEGKFAAALNLLPDQMNSEKNVLRRLIQTPTDWANAYNGVPKNTRLLCLHAYQSYLWNKAVSKRLAMFGMECVPGDLVAIKEQQEPSRSSSSSSTDVKSGVDGVGSVSSSSSAAAAAAVVVAHSNNNQFQRSTNISSNNTSTSSSSSSNSSGSSSGHDGVKIVTAEEIVEQQYSIADVVLPLPGAQIALPKHEIADYYRELLAEDGLSLDSYSTCHVSYREKGAYRRVLQFPQNFEWDMIEYTDPNAELTQTELSTFAAATAPAPAPRPSTPTIAAATAVIDTIDTTIVTNTASAATSATLVTATTSTNATGAGSSTQLAHVVKEPAEDQKTYRALHLQFSLPPGTYATMLLRELTKESTETLYQAQLTKNSTV